ncbi:hypothetical protein [Thermococcus camini]|uniref:Glucodextranase-like C-terminal domain-containing protein n=1 Tax=Thermococcus camini TaxID=2016373 RepID=A0A7G2D504_9EURY|nr:hypothetical protein [Thermococcus camini]CAD5243315.1 conserved exported protein of unknown function [Thermococcus camini]
MRRIIALFVGLLMLGGMMRMVSAHSVTVDGDPADWLADTGTQAINTWQLYSSVGEWVWKDNESDERTDWSTPDPRVDITEFRVTADEQYIYFLIKFNNLDVVGQDGAPGIMITIDTDQSIGSGGTYFGYLSETQVAQNGNANWEYQLLIDLSSSSVQNNQPVYGDGTPVWDSGSPLDLVDTSWDDVSTSSDEFVASTTYNAVEVKILKSELGNPSTIRVELAVVRVNPSGDAWDIIGVSDVLDAMTDVSGNTWNEVKDGYVDYYADINISQVPFFSNNVAMAALTFLLVLGAVWFFRRQ